MRESVMDVLCCLFDDILPQQDAQETDLNQMANWLSEAGFADEDVGRAMNWFYELSQIGEYRPKPEKNGPIRVFSARERYFIDHKGQDFLHRLRRTGILDLVLQEKVIERAIALEEPVSVETLNWVTSMVVANTSAEYTHDQLVWPIVGETRMIQ